MVYLVVSPNLWYVWLYPGFPQPMVYLVVSLTTGNVTNQQSEYDTDELGLVQNNLTSLHELRFLLII